MAAIKHRRLSDRKWHSRRESGTNTDASGVNLCHVSTHSVMRRCTRGQQQNDQNGSIERLMFSLRTISMFESTECVAPCTQGLIDVFAFLEEAHFWRRELVAGASPEHI
jgi:hypothetical protein